MNPAPATQPAPLPASPVEPITVSGWYLRTDHSIGLYQWHKGCPVLVRVLPSWGAVASTEQWRAVYAWVPAANYTGDSIEASR